MGKRVRDFFIEEVAPLRLAHTIFGMIGETKSKVEFRIDPALGETRMRRIAGERRGCGCAY